MFLRTFYLFLCFIFFTISSFFNFSPVFATTASSSYTLHVTYRVIWLVNPRPDTFADLEFSVPSPNYYAYMGGTKSTCNANQFTKTLRSDGQLLHDHSNTCDRVDIVNQYILGSQESNSDFDRDGIPDWQDPDDDNDGITDWEDSHPKDPLNGDVDSDGDGTPDSRDTDRDGDGILNDQDAFPDDPFNNDRDSDGIPNDQDAFPDDPLNGDIDSDGDGIPDSLDADDDNDGVPDPQDEDDNGDGQTDAICEPIYNDQKLAEKGFTLSQVSNTLIQIMPQSPQSVRLPTILSNMMGDGTLGANLAIEAYSAVWQYLTIIVFVKFYKLIPGKST